jgi:hypothetical protein
MAVRRLKTRSVVKFRDAVESSEGQKGARSDGLDDFKEED